MSLAYFPLYADDFEADTAHLTLAEDGAYNRLLRLCWRSPGCSIPADKEWIYRRLRALSDEDRRVIDAVLDEFFTATGGRSSNARLSREWAKAKDAHERRKNAGAKGGKSKALKTNESNSSNATAKPKQPEPEPEPLKREANASPKKRGSRLPGDWALPREWGEWALSEGWPEAAIRDQANRFRDYWISKPGQAGTKLDWLATWRNWMRNSKAPRAIEGGRHDNASKQTDRIAAFIAGAVGTS